MSVLSKADFSHTCEYIHIQLANSNIVKTSDLSRKELSGSGKWGGSEILVGGTTGETRFHSILFARFYPRGDPGWIPAGSLVQISSPASRERSRQVSRGNLGGNLRKYRRALQRIMTSRNSSSLFHNWPFHSFTNLRGRYNRETVFNP